MNEQVKYKEPSWFGEQMYCNHDIPVYYRDTTMSVWSKIEASPNPDAFTKENSYDMVTCLEVKNGLIHKPLTALFWAGINMLYRHYEGFNQEYIHYTTGSSDFDYEVWIFFHDPNRDNLLMEIKLRMHKPIGEKYNN